MMKKNSYYDLAKQKYVEASLQMLDHFKSNVIEVHHIGSSSFASMDTREDIDILVILKSQNQVAELPDVLMAEGYEIVHSFSPYYSNETIVRGSFDDDSVNFIFMAHGEERKEEILDCKLSINSDESEFKKFIELKKQLNDLQLSREEYQLKKEALFYNIMSTRGNRNVV